MDILIIGLTALLGLYMAWNIGANDVANSMADAVGSRSISIRNAVIAAGICEFAGAVLVGAQVTNTVRKGIVDPAMLAAIPGISPQDAAVILVIGMSAALLSAAFWLNLSTIYGMPVSTTHSIVGAVAGFGVVAAGWQAVNWSKMGQIVASWFISPLAGGIMAFLIFNYISKSILGKEQPARAAIRHMPYIVFLMTAVVLLATIYKGLKHVIKNIHWLTDSRALALSLGASLVAAVVSYFLIRAKLQGLEEESLGKQLEAVERVFVPLVIISSCSVAFAHGANDVANSVGPLAAIVHVLKTGTIDMKVPVPLWVLALGGMGIVLGLATYGYRVMMTVGTKITEITPSRGVAADIAATATVLACTRLSLPVSTTHTLVGAILGIGLARGLGGINRRIVTSIFGSWLFTVPAAALMSMFFFMVGKALFFETLHTLIAG
ncbi:phosphate transporter [Desulfolithobacter dissulfuricans]|uniref:Phosphate transporter n=1 Tax=Desulfolithobacter dissulfuricans TaxID=2795293 RepID=A0A915XJR9_9BACT|nr:inorganic phosphate transporter [Desulfolithobacter dissulfuricans]BCO08248.1 phosphate transporter [Desulfolithobacter dissulfuricans]